MQGLKHALDTRQLLAEKSGSWSSLGSEAIGAQAAGITSRMQGFKSGGGNLPNHLFKALWMLSYLKSLGTFWRDSQYS